jgi:2-hydroxychromene-2-carboxylate isomerase
MTDDSGDGVLQTAYRMEGILKLEMWFDFGSTYSYVAAMRVEAACAAAGIELAYKPFLLGPIFTQQLGIKDSPFNVHRIRGRYMWRELERLCAKYSLPWRRPSVFPRNGLLAARVACASDVPVGAFVRAVFRANFAEDREIEQPAIVRELVESVGGDGARALEIAGTPEAKVKLRENTARAQALGIFGAPDFVIGEELFFGQDRMDDAIAFAVRPP